MSALRKKVVLIDYTNHRGEREVREILPEENGIRYGATAWHPEAQWLLSALDLGKNQHREFAMKDIHRWEPVER